MIKGVKKSCFRVICFVKQKHFIKVMMAISLIRAYNGGPSRAQSLSCSAKKSALQKKKCSADHLKILQRFPMFWYKIFFFLCRIKASLFYMNKINLPCGESSSFLSIVRPYFYVLHHEKEKK